MKIIFYCHYVFKVTHTHTKQMDIHKLTLNVNVQPVLLSYHLIPGHYTSTITDTQQISVPVNYHNYRHLRTDSSTLLHLPPSFYKWLPSRQWSVIIISSQLKWCLPFSTCTKSVQECKTWNEARKKLCFMAILWTW